MQMWLSCTTQFGQRVTRVFVQYSFQKQSAFKAKAKSDRSTKMEETTSVPVIAVTAAVGAVVVLLIMFCNMLGRQREENEKDAAESDDTKTTKQDKPVNKKVKADFKTRKPKQANFTHKWLASTLKGHGAAILDMDFSPNGKHVITVAEDRSVIMWSTKDFEEKVHKFVRGNVELDHATRVKFSPDSKAFVVSLGNSNTLRIFRIGKKEDGSAANFVEAADFPQKHTAEIINIGIASHGKFIMSCSADTTIIVWSIKGDVFKEINTNHMTNNFATVSPCGRFIASAGFTPDVKVWEVSFSKSDEFEDVKRAFELKGHSAGVDSCSFNNDSTRMASVSKDGTWKFWDTNIRYDMNQDPYLLYTGTLQLSGPALISLSPDGRTVAIAQDGSIYVCNSSGSDDELIENVHSETPVQIGFDNSGKYLLTAGDKHVLVLHNVTGYKAMIEELLVLEKKAATNALKQRIKSQIDDARNALQRILGEANGHVASK